MQGGDPAAAVVEAGTPRVGRCGGNGLGGPVCVWGWSPGLGRGYLEDEIGVVLVQHVGLAEGGYDHPAVPPRRLQVGVEPVLGAVHREKAVHQVPLDLGQAVRGGQEVLHALLHLVAAEAGPQQDGDEHGSRGEEHRVAGDEVAEPGEGRPQPPVQDLPQHPSAEGAQGGRAPRRGPRTFPTAPARPWGSPAGGGRRRRSCACAVGGCVRAGGGVRLGRSSSCDAAGTREELARRLVA